MPLVCPWEALGPAQCRRINGQTQFLLPTVQRARIYITMAAASQQKEPLAPPARALPLAGNCIPP